MTSEDNNALTRVQYGPRIYFGIGLLCFLISVYAATNLLSAPVKTWQPIDVAEAISGFVIFLYLSWVGLSGKQPIARERSRVTPAPKLPKFFVRALLLGLALGGAVAYWQGTAMGWSVLGAIALAIAIMALSGAIIVIVLRLRRR